MPVTPGESMITVTGGSKQPGTPPGSVARPLCFTYKTFTSKQEIVRVERQYVETLFIIYLSGFKYAQSGLLHLNVL